MHCNVIPGLILLAALTGCTTGVFRSQSPEPEPPAEVETTLIGDMARAYGTQYVKVEGISLVTGLNGTGEDPAPSPQRAAVLAEMQRRKVPSPTLVLASPDTALVLVRGYLRPGIQKGDPFDVEIRVPSRSETTSLVGGYLLETRMTEYAVLDNQIRTGHLLALARGAVLADSEEGDQEEPRRLPRGTILGGGVALKSRMLGLVLNEEHQAVRNSQQIGKAINLRFHTYINGIKRGVAKPKTDEFVELAVHPRYRDNIHRYMQVVRSIAFRETRAQADTRRRLLERQLLDPVTTRTAAIRLEAIGKAAIESLQVGLQSSDAEVRFASAEALAYLEQSEAAPALGEAAREHRAFRVGALAALTVLNDLAALDELRALLSVESAETRYGAFRAIWMMNPADPMIRGENLGGKFNYHLLDVPGPPMIHVARSHRPEIVVFDSSQRFKLPMVLEAGKYILINGREEGQVSVSRFEPGQPDQKRIVSPKVDDVIRAIVELGGTYPDVVQALRQAEEQGALVGRFEIGALPESGRTYQRPTRTTARGDSDSEKDDAEDNAWTSWLTPWKKF